jgi:hypothetical protein
LAEREQTGLFEVNMKFNAEKSGSLLDTPPMFNLLAKIDEFETLPVFVLTN